MTTPSEWSATTQSDLLTIGEKLRDVARNLHEHTRKLETAVEGKYASESGDPRVRLLSEALNVSRSADLHLGKLSHSLQLFLQQMPTGPLPEQATGSQNGSQQPAQSSGIDSERERLTTHITTLRQQRNELQTLYGIAQTLNSTLKFDEVLRIVMDQVIEVVKAERGFLMLVHPESGELEFTIARNNQALPIEESEFNISRGTVKHVIQTREPLLADDAQVDEQFRGQLSIITNKIRALMCVPLVVRNTCIGAVYVDSRLNARLFEQKHLDLLVAFCHQAAIAIDNARLFTRVNEDKQYMDNIFGSIANGVITTDSNGIVKTFNSAARHIFKLEAGQVLEKHYTEAFSMMPQLGLIERLSDATVRHEHGTIVPGEVSCSIPGRGDVDLSFYISALRDSENAHIGTAIVVDDLTELKRSRAEAKQIRRIFERYVHPNVVEQLIKDPRALNLGGETKEISVVFADIRGYTRLSENMLPEEVMNLINRYLNIMCEAIWEEEGTLTAFQGDALMAIFSAPLAQPMHALHAVRASWKMRQAVLDYQRIHPREPSVSFGFGVNTGLATVGNVGSLDRMQNYTAIGDVVNVASRLQSNVADNNILLNESTYLQVASHVQVGQVFSLQVKNKTAPLNVRYLVGLP